MRGLDLTAFDTVDTIKGLDLSAFEEVEMPIAENDSNESQKNLVETKSIDRESPDEAISDSRAGKMSVEEYIQQQKEQKGRLYPETTEQKTLEIQGVSSKEENKVEKLQLYNDSLLTQDKIFKETLSTIKMAEQAGDQEAIQSLQPVLHSSSQKADMLKQEIEATKSKLKEENPNSYSANFSDGFNIMAGTILRSPSAITDAVLIGMKDLGVFPQEMSLDAMRKISETASPLMSASDRIGKIGSAMIKEAEKEGEKRNTGLPYGGSAWEALKDGNIALSGELASKAFTNSLMSSAAFLFAPTAIATGAGMVGSEITDIEENTIDGANSGTVLAGSIKAALEYTTERMFGAGRATRELITKMGKDAATKMVAESAKETVKRTLGRKITQTLGEEVVGEAANQIGSNAADIYINGKDISITQGVGDAALIGLFGGVVQGGGTTTVSHYLDKKRLKEAEAKRDAAAKLMQQALEVKTVPVKNILEDEAAANVKEANEIVDQQNIMGAMFDPVKVAELEAINIEIDQIHAELPLITDPVSKGVLEKRLEEKNTRSEALLAEMNAPKEKVTETVPEETVKPTINEKTEEVKTEETEVKKTDVLTENVPEETKVTEAVSSEPLNEAKKIATENEFKHPEHLLNAVAKATGEKPATVQETTLGALEKVKQQRDQLTKKVIDKKSEESISPEPLKSETDATKEISKQESVSPKPESGDQSRKETKPSSSDSVLGEKKSTGESEKALTDLESAKQKRKEAKASLDAHRKNLGISFDSKERAKRLYEYHSALVAEAKEYIKKGINDVKEFAKEIDEKLSDAVKRAWDEATGKQKFEQKYFESVKDASDNFNDLVTKNIESDVVKETLSNVERETGRELTKEEKEYKEKALRTALSHGEEVVTQAKVEFGDNYVTDLLEYLDENKNKLSTDQKSLIQIALELDLERQIKEKPDLTIEKQLKLVRDKSIAEQRSAAQAIGYGRLRQIARVGYDVNKVTDQFFSSEQLEGKQKVEKAIQSSAKEIQKEAERKETEQGKVDIAEKEKRKQKRKQKRAERIKKADAQISEAASEIAQAFGWETNIIGDKRPNAVKSLVKLGDGLIKKGEATVENVYEKIKEHLKDKFGKDLPDTYKKEVENSLKTTKTAAEKNIARLEKELENVQQGKIKIRDVREKTAREKELRDQINDAKEELGLIESKPLGKEVAQTVKQHLIDEGFGKELKDGKKVLDWIKLAGEEGSVDKMKQIVSNSLEKEGYTKEQITEIQKSLENEYHDLRASIIEKSLNELESRNKVSQTETKSSARKLAELYNLGLFEKEATTYDNILNKALGLSDIGQKHFAEAKKLAESLSELYSTQNKGKTVNELGIAHATRVINAEIETLLSKIAWEQSNGAFKAAVIAKEYMGLAQRNMLVSLKQGIENPLSGFIQRAFTALGFSFDKVDSKVLRQNRSKLAKVIYDDAVRNGGLIYGDITTPFISHTHTINWLNKKSDSQIYHTAVSGMIGRAFLEGADSMHKTALVERYFTYNLIKILTDSKNPNRMGKQEAVNFVSEQLTGQSLTDARVTAKEIITRVNTKAGKEVLADNKQTIERLANDIIKDSLIKGEKLTTKEIEASYKSAYDAAGFDLGHESNNLISMGVGKGTAYVEHQIKTAVKEKRWSEAAAWTFSSILTKNILNPFVGGGTNWVVLTLQKSGIDFVSPLWDYARKKSNPLDVTTEAGIKNMEKALQKNLRSKNTSTRFIVGAMASIITYSAARASGADEDINAWIKKNEWSRKFFNVVAPQSLVFLLYQKNKELGKYFGSLLNIKTDNFDDAKRLQSAIDKISKGKKEEGWQKGGELVGGKTSMPLIPYRIATQVQDVVRGVQGKSPIKFDFESKGFVEGYYDQGIVNYVARLIDPQPYKNAKSKFTGSTTDPEELKLTPEEKRQMKEDAEEAKKLLREEKNYVE